MGNTGITVEQLKTELASLRTCITAILTAGQSVSRTGLSYTRADLAALQQRETYLVRSINRAYGGIIAVGEVRGSTTSYPDDSSKWDG